MERLAERLRLPPAVAGATLLSLGNGAPDIFTQMSAVASSGAGQQGLEMALSEPMGNGMFIGNVVVAIIILTAPAQRVVLQHGFFLKDCLFYLGAVLMVFGFLLHGEIHTPHLWLLVGYYALYMAVTVYLSRGEEPVHVDPKRHEVPHQQGLSLLEGFGDKSFHRHSSFLSSESLRQALLSAAAYDEEAGDGAGADGMPSSRAQGVSAWLRDAETCRGAPVHGDGHPHVQGGSPTSVASRDSHANTPGSAFRKHTGILRGSDGGASAAGTPALRKSVSWRDHSVHGADLAMDAAVLYTPTSPLTPRSCSGASPLRPADRGGSGSGAGEAYQEGVPIRTSRTAPPSGLETIHSLPADSALQHADRDWLVAALADGLESYHRSRDDLTREVEGGTSQPTSSQQQQQQVMPLTRVSYVSVQESDIFKDEVAVDEDQGRDPRGWLAERKERLLQQRQERQQMEARKYSVWEQLQRPLLSVLMLTMPRISNRGRSGQPRYPKAYAVLLPLVLPLLASWRIGVDLSPAAWRDSPPLQAAGIACVIASSWVLLAYPWDGRLKGLLLELCTLLAFGMSMMWMAAAADQVVGVTGAIGCLLDINSSVFGATLLAWGSSTSDVISDIALARDGYPTMALTACYGSPLFVLIGGLFTTLLFGAPEGVLPLPQQLSIRALYAISTVNMLVWSICIPFVFKFTLNRYMAVLALLAYVTYTCTYIYISISWSHPS